MVKVELVVKDYDSQEPKMQAIVKRVMFLTKQKFIELLVDNSPKDTGNLAGWKAEGSGDGLSYKFKSPADYVTYVEYGTGLYGPKKQLITPGLKKKALAFNYKGESVVVRSVKGMKPRKMVQKSMKQIPAYIPEALAIAIAEAKK